MMKYIILITVFLISILSFSQNANKSVQGEFNGRLCDIGRGLCAITPPNATIRNATTKIFNVLTQSENSLVVEIDPAVLSTDEQKKVLGKEIAKIAKNEVLIFLQEDDFLFSPEILNYIGINSNLKNLKKGNYAVSILKNKILITLILSKD